MYSEILSKIIYRVHCTEGEIWFLEYLITLLIWFHDLSMGESNLKIGSRAFYKTDCDKSKFEKANPACTCELILVVKCMSTVSFNIKVHILQAQCWVITAPLCSIHCRQFVIKLCHLNLLKCFTRYDSI